MHANIRLKVVYSGFRRFFAGISDGCDSNGQWNKNQGNYHVDLNPCILKSIKYSLMVNCLNHSLFLHWQAVPPDYEKTFPAHRFMYFLGSSCQKSIHIPLSESWIIHKWTRTGFALAHEHRGKDWSVALYFTSHWAPGNSSIQLVEWMFI